MSRRARDAVEGPSPEGLLRAVEPTEAAEVVAVAPQLVGFYNDSHNRQVLRHLRFVPRD